MRHNTVRMRTTLALASVAGLALSLLGGGAASAGTAQKQAPAVRWSRVTPAGTAIIDDIGLARGNGGILHVLWTTDRTPNQSIMDTPVGANGAVGRPTTIARFFLATDPDATVTRNGLTAIWNGIKANAAHSPQGTFQAARPLSGGRWTVPAAHVEPLPGVPFTSSSDTATTGSDGRPWVAFNGTDSLAVDHFGHPEVELGPTNRCCVIEPGLATDGRTGTTWVTYASLIGGHQGVFARPLLASGRPAGPAELLPGSVTGGSIILPQQRVGTTGRGPGRPGAYAVYERGFPFARALEVDRLGSRAPVTVATFGGTSEQLQGSTVTAAPGGRLVVAWFFGRGTPPALFVRVSNSAATAYGKARRIPLPAGTTTVWKVYISAQATKIDIVALVTLRGSSRTTAYWHAQIP
jgi:hypothetical protein